LVFTKYPEKPKKKEIQMKDEYIAKINSILKEVFNIKKEQILPEVKVYYIDTDIDDETNEYIKKFQDTVDIILEQILLISTFCGSIDTRNFDKNGKFVKERREYLNQQFEELKKNVEKEKQEKENLQKDSEDFNLDENTRLIRKNSLRKLEENEEKQKESFKKLEEEIKKRQNVINDKAKKKGIEFGVLDKKVIGCIFLTIGGLIFSAICPEFGLPLIFYTNLGYLGYYSSFLFKIIKGKLKEIRK
jgi:hypothetical protein